MGRAGGIGWPASAHWCLDTGGGSRRPCNALVPSSGRNLFVVNQATTAQHGTTLNLSDQRQRTDSAA